MTITHLLNRTMRVWHRDDVQDDGGGRAAGWVDQQRSVKVRLSSASPAQRQTAAQEGVEITHVGFMLPGVDVARGSRLVDDDISVVIVSLVTPSRPDFLRADCREEPWV